MFKRIVSFVQDKKTDMLILKGNAQFVLKVTFEPLMDSNQNHYGSWNYCKSCYF